jgi:hypothetical protein
MIKKTILTTILLLSTATFADSIRCTMDASVIGTDGLATAKGNTVWQTQIQTENTGVILHDDYCNKYSVSATEAVLFCAAPSEAIGVTVVATVVVESGLQTQNGAAILGTSSKNRGELLNLNSETIVFNSFKETLKSLGISSPVAYTGDSLLFDEAIVMANKKSKKSLIGQLVLISVKSCELIK